MHLPFSKVGSPTLKIGLAETIMAYLSIMHVPLYVVHHACGQPCMVLPRFPKIPQDSPFGPLRGAAWRPWPLAPPGPPVFFVGFFVFARPPAGSDYPGRPLNERSKTLRPTAEAEPAVQTEGTACLDMQAADCLREAHR